MGYADLLRRLLDATQPDQRIRGVWLGGSIGRGVADAGSDLDVLMAVEDNSMDEFAGSWRPWLQSITPVLFAHAIPGMPGSFSATTSDCLRLDVVVERVSELATTPYLSRLLVFDRDGSTLSRLDPLACAGLDLDAIASLVQEFYRQRVIFPPAVVARVDWLLGVVAVHNMQRLLYQLFVAVNEPLPAMGVKQWGSRLTRDQKVVLTRLPQPNPDRDSVIDAMTAVCTAVCVEARQAVEDIGGTWPVAIDAAVATYWHRSGLG